MAHAYFYSYCVFLFIITRKAVARLKVARCADFALRNGVIFALKMLEVYQHLNNIYILAFVFLSHKKDLKLIQVPKLAVKLNC